MESIRQNRRNYNEAETQLIESDRKKKNRYHGLV